MKTLVVRETMVYDKFGFLLGINRPIIPSHVAKLRKSIVNMGCTRGIVVAMITFLGRPMIYIIDGQHLFEALRGLGLAIPYTTIVINSKKELINKIALLNASSKSWCLADYVQAWKLIVPDYITLEEFKSDYNLSFVSLAAIGMNLTESRTISPLIKSGDFRIQNTRFVEIVKESRKLLDQVNVNGVYSQEFVLAYLRYINNNHNYCFEAIVENIKRSKEMVEAAAGNRETFYTILESKVFC
jgi:hypothetical protein